MCLFGIHQCLTVVLYPTTTLILESFDALFVHCRLYGRHRFNLYISYRISNIKHGPFYEIFLLWYIGLIFSYFVSLLNWCHACHIKTSWSLMMIRKYSNETLSRKVLKHEVDIQYLFIFWHSLAVETDKSLRGEIPALWSVNTCHAKLSEWKLKRISCQGIELLALWIRDACFCVLIPPSKTVNNMVFV